MQTAEPYILIVDDDPEDRQVFSSEFIHQNPGIAVEHIESGLELLGFLNECPSDRFPAMIILDYQMPDLNGPQILQALATDDRYKPIVKVMWSTSCRVKDMEECKQLGAADYLVKPGTMEELKKAVHQVTLLFRAVTRLTL